MSITARGGYQILDFTGEEIIKESLYVPDAYRVYNPELFSIIKNQRGKKNVIACGYAIVDDVKEGIIPCDVSSISFLRGSTVMPDGYSLYIDGLLGGTEVIIYNKER